MTEKRTKPSASGAVMRTAFVLLMLMLVSTYLAGGLLAKYSTTAAGSDTARVAKFDVDITGAPSDDIAVACTTYDANTGIYTITIENNSEVAVHYDLSVALTGETDGVSAEFSPASGDLAVGASDESKLTFTVNWSQFTEKATGSSAEQTLDFTVTVNVTQID